MCIHTIHKQYFISVKATFWQGFKPSKHSGKCNKYMLKKKQLSYMGHCGGREGCSFMITLNLCTYCDITSSPQGLLLFVVIVAGIRHDGGYLQTARAPKNEGKDTQKKYDTWIWRKCCKRGRGWTEDRPNHWFHVGLNARSDFKHWFIPYYVLHSENSVILNSWSIFLLPLHFAVILEEEVHLTCVAHKLNKVK